MQFFFVPQISQALALAAFYKKALQLFSSCVLEMQGRWPKIEHVTTEYCHLRQCFCTAIHEQQHISEQKKTAHTFY